MKDKVTRISLDQAGNGKTDWTAIESLSEVQIDARALLDSDTLLPSAKDLGLAEGSDDNAPSFTIYEGKDGGFRWRLAAADGRLFAMSGESYSTRAQAVGSLKQMLAALGKVDQLAA
ncbi:MAG: DUF1508 domain-containing protein [Proteobacteria bacterium]|nr:DUF1508 domain-containing protein [Pseudomonadota bacterium]